MADDDAGDKTEAPTPKRRQQAREQGNIARSPDLTAAVLMLAFMMLLKWYGSGLFDSLKTIMAEMLGGEGLKNPTIGDAYIHLLFALRVAARGLTPVLLGAMFVIIVVNLAQVGLFFNLERIQPNFAALNPFKGISKIFSGSERLVSLGMNLLKLCLISMVAYSAVHGRLSLILSAQQLTFVQIFGLGTEIVYAIAIRIGMLLLLLALIDFGYQKYRTEQQLKMSKQEIKEEMRSMDGDPKIKARRRQIAIQRVRQGIRKNVPTADVIVTNPTEYAVALKYDSDKMHAPRVVAKGTDQIALHIRQVAAEHGIPILERPPLARALYRLVDIGQEIPEQFYSTVAEILAYVYELNGKLRGRRREAVTN